jgi:hypothetical protein
MPILNDIMDHKVLGPAIRQGRQEGLLEGQQGVLRRILKKRFGQIPKWAEARLVSLSASDLDQLADRVLDASRLEELFPQKP